MNSNFKIVLAAAAVLLVGASCERPPTLVVQAPVPTVQTFVIADTRFTVARQGWIVVQQDATHVKIKTASSPYEVYITVTAHFPGTRMHIEGDQGQMGKDGIETEWIPRGGGPVLDSFYVRTPNGDYNLDWDVESTEPEPANWDGPWVPDLANIDANRAAVGEILRSAELVQSSK